MAFSHSFEQGSESLTDISVDSTEAYISLRWPGNATVASVDWNGTFREIAQLRTDPYQNQGSSYLQTPVAGPISASGHGSLVLYGRSWTDTHFGI